MGEIAPEKCSGARDSAAVLVVDGSRRLSIIASSMGLRSVEVHPWFLTPVWHAVVRIDVITWI